MREIDFNQRLKKGAEERIYLSENVPAICRSIYRYFICIDAFIVCGKSLRTKSNGTYKQHTNAQVDDENASSYTIYLLNGYTKLLFLT